MRTLTLTLTLLAALGSLAAKEVEVTIDQVPAPVKATILKAAGDQKVAKIEQDTKKDGTVVYAAEWTDKDGVTEVEVKIAADGTLLKTEREGKDAKDDDADEKGEHAEKAAEAK